MISKKIILLFLFLSTLSQISASATQDSLVAKIYNYYSSWNDFDMQIYISKVTDNNQLAYMDTCRYIKYNNYYYSRCETLTEIKNDSLVISIDEEDKKITLVKFPTAMEGNTQQLSLSDIIGFTQFFDSVYVTQEPSFSTITYIANGNNIYPKISLNIDESGSVTDTRYYFNNIDNSHYHFDFLPLALPQNDTSFFDIFQYIQFQNNNYVPSSSYHDYSLEILYYGY